MYNNTRAKRQSACGSSPYSCVNQVKTPCICGTFFLCPFNGVYHQRQMCRVAPCVPVQFRVLRFTS
nr:MAG TPA: hypothetical protein [Caudoviricetes sp.]